MASGNGHTGERSARMLIVDDEPENCAFLQRLFKNEYDVQIATSGERALRMLESESFDVIITDQVMPGLSGTDLLTKSLALAPDAVRILISGFPNLETAITSINEGRAYRFFTRPIDRHELRDAVVEAVTGQGTSRELLNRTAHLEKENHTLVAERTSLEQRINAEVDTRAQGLRAEVDRLKRTSVIDETTGLFTRQALVERLHQEADRSERYGLLCALVLIRLDDFRAEQLEDSEAAQRVLERVAWLIRLGSRRYDLGGRWSEDTFGLVLPHVGKSGADARIARMRETASAPEKGQPVVRFRAAAVAFPESGHTVDTLVALAERSVDIG